MPNKKPPRNVLNIDDIHLEWDADAELRQRLLDGGSVMAPGPCCEDISTCLKNRSLLAPILFRMASNESRKVPPIDPLLEEIQRLLSRAKRAEVDSELISKSAGAIKKLCGFVKMKCRRREVSTVTGMQICRIQFRCFTNVSNVESFICEPLPLAPIHSHPTAKVRAFQDLCLILDPLLQANPEKHDNHIIFIYNSILISLSQSTHNPSRQNMGFHRYRWRWMASMKGWLNVEKKRERRTDV